jgi:N-methylhydantoinase A
MVPVRPGVLSAFGMLQANVRHDVVRSYFGRLGDLDLSAMATGFAELRQQGSALLRSDGIGDEALMLEGSVDLRYVGQEYTLTIPFAATVDVSTVSVAAEAFHDAYKIRYGHNNPDEALEVVSLRITAVGLRPEIGTPRMSERATPVPKATIQTRFADSAVPTAVYDRTHLGSGSRVAGPAVLLEDGCTTLVPPGWSVALTTVGHMMLERAE